MHLKDELLRFYQVLDKNWKVLISDLLLVHFNPAAEIFVASDTSKNSIGAIMLHKYKDGYMKMVIHASLYLISAEKKNYCQIVEEALAVIFAVKTFHKFLHGRSLRQQTNHRPLLFDIWVENRNSYLYCK